MVTIWQTLGVCVQKFAFFSSFLSCSLGRTHLGVVAAADQLPIPCPVSYCGQPLNISPMAHSCQVSTGIHSLISCSSLLSSPYHHSMPYLQHQQQQCPLGQQWPIKLKRGAKSDQASQQDFGVVLISHHKHYSDLAKHVSAITWSALTCRSSW